MSCNALMHSPTDTCVLVVN
ncbi:hypothetical protein ACJIZ3_021734 [Penstemon smallii]|uniref:Uncharacterized protein n=1 Tax=Penstemon smallii TaxID=265156 RepID=A0ABD3SMI4_9LAMI